MKNKSLGQLKKRIQRAKNPDQLKKIEQSCNWGNCAVGTKLREFGIDLDSVIAAKKVSAYYVLRQLVKPEIINKGENFNYDLDNGDKDKALKFIKELESSGPLDILA